VSQEDYYLLGLLDDGMPSQNWRSLLIRNPLQILLATGEFDIQAKLVAPAKAIFSIEDALS
jgi:hypothetical protein